MSDIESKNKHFSNTDIYFYNLFVSSTKKNLFFIKNKINTKTNTMQTTTLYELVFYTPKMP